MKLLSSIFSTFLCCAAVLPAAHAQEYPTRPIRLIVANGPGSGPDVVFRIVEPAMSKFLGQAVVIENRAGAGSIIGYELVKQATPDGYMIGAVTVPTLASLPIAVKNLRFKPLSDFIPVIDLVEARFTLLTSPKHPWKNFDELIAHAKSNPGKLNYGASTFLVRLQTETIVRAKGLNMVPISYKEQPGMVTAGLTGEVAMIMLSFGTAVPLSDRLRIIGVTGDKRSPRFPDVPTFNELGVNEVRGTSFSLYVPLGTPKPIVDKLNAATVFALKQPDVITRFTTQGLDIVAPALQTPAAAAKRLADEGQAYADIARNAGIKPE